MEKIMKAGNRLQKTAALLLTLALSAGMLAGTAMASEAAHQETLYTVRILPGAQGTIPGGVQVYPNMHYGDQISFDINTVTVDGTKYYAKGLKDSGMDPNHPTSDFDNSG